jgi:hypothetical protein
LNKLAYDVARFDEHDHYHGPKNCKGYRQDFGSLLGGGLLLFFSHVPVTTVAGDRPALDWFAKRLREYRDNGIALMLLGWYWDGATLTRLLEPDDDLGVRWSGLLDGSPVGSSVDGAPLF